MPKATAKTGGSPAELVARAGQKAADAARCIRRLAEVGGDEALAAVYTYAGLHPAKFGQSYADAVARAVVFAWNRFGAPDFAQRMFANATTVDLTNSDTDFLDSVAGLELLPNLTSLCCRVNPSVDLRPLAGSQSLTHLALAQPDGDSAPDLSCIPQLPGLRFFGGVVETEENLRFVASSESLMSVRIGVGKSVRLAPIVPPAVLMHMGLTADPNADGALIRAIATRVLAGAEWTIEAATLANPLATIRDYRIGAESAATALK